MSMSTLPTTGKEIRTETFLNDYTSRVSWSFLEEYTTKEKERNTISGVHQLRSGERDERRAKQLPLRHLQQSRGSGAKCHSINSRKNPPEVESGPGNACGGHGASGDDRPPPSSSLTRASWIDRLSQKDRPGDRVSAARTRLREARSGRRISVVAVGSGKICSSKHPPNAFIAQVETLTGYAMNVLELRNPASEKSKVLIVPLRSTSARKAAARSRHRWPIAQRLKN
ncbi:hypothetical protein C8R45DRAFT_1079052 [Mycena sanguinolenta]|nr:hypothetical protein C8R45DRAFT_1079052 [Mycena sanguinolenta]